MKLIFTATAISLLSSAAFAAHPNSTSGGESPQVIAQSSDNAGDNRTVGEGYIYGGFGPYNDSR